MFFAKFCGNLGREIPGEPSNCVAYGAKQVVPLSLQNEFVLTRVTCRFLRNGANKFAVSLRERGRINECWICKLSSLGTSALWCNERIKDCLINRMSSVQSSVYICFSRQWFKFFYVRRNIRFRAEEPVCAVLNVNRKPIYWSCGRQEKEMEQLGNVWIWNGNIMMKGSYGSYSIRIMNWNIPVSGLCVQRKWIRASLERVKRSKSSIRSKCHRVIGIFAFSLFMMHV